MRDVFNFSAGPAKLADPVLQQAQKELLDWNETGMSLLETPHRSVDFQAIAAEAAQDLRDLLHIPENYQVLFLHGGGRTQFAMVPMNFAHGYGSMAYVETGIWSKLAIAEARRFGKVCIAASAADSNFCEMPEPTCWQIPDDAAFVHYTDNETIGGVEFFETPNIKALPLITDMSSNLLSKPLDINKFGLIYACAQKNIGPAGITVVIVRDDLLLREPFAHTPSMLRYSVHADSKSLYNTPATFAWYMAGLTFKWLKREGGIAKMALRNRKKATKLYSFIDSSDFYVNKIKPKYRSQMNVVFQLANESMNELFLTEANKQGLTNLKGHRTVGGMRASIYNAMPERGVDRLVAFMRDFEKQRA